MTSVVPKTRNQLSGFTGCGKTPLSGLYNKGTASAGPIKPNEMSWASAPLLAICRKTEFSRSLFSPCGVHQD
jgi:hypothetical protein